MRSNIFAVFLIGLCIIKYDSFYTRMLSRMLSHTYRIIPAWAGGPYAPLHPLRAIRRNKMKRMTHENLSMSLDYDLSHEDSHNYECYFHHH